MNDPLDFDHEEEPLGPSRSQLKREAEALQDLGAELVQLKAAQLDAIPLPERLREAVLEARRIKSHGALRRQMQFVGKVMRGVEAEPIREALDRLLNRDRAAAARFHQLERWRDRLIEEGDGALAEWFDAYPGSDRQHLRQLVRNAVKERAGGKPAGAGRALFRHLREVAEGDDG
ncbi:ribosome biogenesis factor YjgA [Endothiovibrio diazotrophicus]